LKIKVRSEGIGSDQAKQSIQISFVSKQRTERVIGENVCYRERDKKEQLLLEMDGPWPFAGSF